MKKEIAVIGLGRFGGSIVMELSEMDVDVLVIDTDEARVNEYQDYYSEGVIGDSTDEAMLKSLGIKNYDNVIVAIGDNIQSSILTTLILKDLGVKKVTTKAQNSYHGRVLEKIGADTVVHPERDMGRRIAHRLVSSSVVEYLEVSNHHSIIEFTSSAKFENKRINDLNMRKKFGISIIAIKRDNDLIVSPDPNISILSGDILILIGSDEQLNHFENYMDKL
ncbi:Ktr system potassium uptake protein A [Jeotgalicoccus aerolatus]|uniref:Trk system potassium uptake protein TrkA n=1 Tax=Jeotgalicoccus aerolatus TaxID=709510 RepID=A0A1G8VYL6_9STAP|nr:TrkA family potassium uptake protein [Jeotgalicoccus aerolatus]MBP1951347.1 trk system potassium uptake protein TrkA [Jeotgalicoccus aerolatus]NMA80857.1 TrkA family potassium uptake protein [Jeotgalicoccus aerolatus]CAD2077041.1 Ktr system potassium uptake protein A [Jeotgalicoccus aerolatus]SDJ70585.1 trk system potassium uptake protein TrkA [Jeotgalicoccus aerolatus]GGD98201.1 potassium transporter Trk [Jeotgalicoccus aerolatus]